MSDRTSKKLRAFMAVCEQLSVLSHDPKYQVATIIITDDFREICAIGYNGDYRGGPNSRASMDHGKSAFLHSEENALFHLSKPFEMRHGLILMCTHKPCTMCAKRIANSGIKRVVYLNDYVDELGMSSEIFASTGIICVKFDELVTRESVTDFVRMRASQGA